MTISVTPTSATLGAEIGAVSLRNLDDATWQEIERAFNDHGVLIFHQQHLTRDEQVEFALRFGELDQFETRPYDTRASDQSGAPLILELSNIDPNGVHITDGNHPQTRWQGGNEAWHTDSSFKPRGAKASILAAIEVTKNGGDTEFADMRAAYDVLNDAVKEILQPLRAWHSIAYSRAIAGAFDLLPAGDPTEMAGAEHPIVRSHPATGQPSLFIGHHACAIAGMETRQAQSLLAKLIEDACRPPRTYTHKWSAGDVVVWDNRCTMHRAKSWDLTERRVLRHVRVVGE